MPPPNDNFASAQILTGASGTVDGTNVDATLETGEPDRYNPNSTFGVLVKSVWYQWTAPLTGYITLTWEATDFDAIMHVWTGSAVNALTLVRPTYWRTRPPRGHYRICVQSGVIYRIQIGGAPSGFVSPFVSPISEGTFTLGWEAVDDTPVSIPIDPATGTANVGTPAYVLHDRTGYLAGFRPHVCWLRDDAFLVVFERQEDANEVVAGNQPVALYGAVCHVDDDLSVTVGDLQQLGSSWLNAGSPRPNAFNAQALLRLDDHRILAAGKNFNQTLRTAFIDVDDDEVATLSAYTDFGLSLSSYLLARTDGFTDCGEGLAIFVESYLATPDEARAHLFDTVTPALLSGNVLLVSGSSESLPTPLVLPLTDDDFLAVWITTPNFPYPTPCKFWARGMRLDRDNETLTAGAVASIDAVGATGRFSNFFTAAPHGARQGTIVMQLSGRHPTDDDMQAVTVTVDAELGVTFSEVVVLPKDDDGHHHTYAASPAAASDGGNVLLVAVTDDQDDCYGGDIEGSVTSSSFRSGPYIGRSLTARWIGTGPSVSHGAYAQTPTVLANKVDDFDWIDWTHVAVAPSGRSLLVAWEEEGWWEEDYSDMYFGWYVLVFGMQVAGPPPPPSPPTPDLFLRSTGTGVRVWGDASR